MTNKSTEAYTDVFEYIEKNIFNLKPASFMTDFEGGMRAAINQCYPDAVLHGCWYHYKAAVRRRCVVEGLYKMITENPSVRTVYRMLLNLPLLPPDSIERGFDITVATSRSMKVFKFFKKIFEYFRGYWIVVVNGFVFIFSSYQSKKLNCSNESSRVKLCTFDDV